MNEHQRPARDESTQSRLREWVEETLPRALAFARSVTLDSHVAEDVVHDCYGRLLSHQDRYDLVRDGWKILLRSITHACIDHRRRHSRTQSTDPTLLDGVAEEHGDGVGGRARVADPQSLAQANELHEAIRAALETLPTIQRAALELRSLGHSLAEVGEALAVSENHAAVLVHRARKAMSKLLANHLPESSVDNHGSLEAPASRKA